MKPVRHAGSNVVYAIDHPGISDLWVERIEDGEVQVVFEFDDHDREAIANGARVMFVMLAEPIPPLAVTVLEPGMCEPVAEHGWKGQSMDDLPDRLPEHWKP